MKFNTERLDKIDIERLYKEFKKQYKFLYDNYDYVDGYKRAVEAFDNFADEHADFVSEFVNYRRDFISSDREAAAFIFALDFLTDDFDLDKYLDDNPDSVLTPVYRGGYWIYEL